MSVEVPGESSWPQLWDARPGYLNTATVGLPPRRAMQALRAVLDGWSVGAGTDGPWPEPVELARSRFAALVQADVANVFTGSNVSAMAALVAARLPDHARVVVPKGEFTSVVFPFAAHADRGVSVTEVALTELADALDDGVHLVSFSIVQSADGAIADVPAITEAARRHGIITFADATQAAGWLPVRASDFDVCVVGAYKWLMAPHGVAFGVVAPEFARSLRPMNAGWYAGADEALYGLPLRLQPDARRFSVSPSGYAYAAAAESLAIVGELGAKAIGAHDVALAQRFCAGLDLPPTQSAIVAVSIPDAAEKLAKAGIRAAVRGGRARLAFHAYTTIDDVDAAVRALTS